jgi:hypothetical protein
VSIIQAGFIEDGALVYLCNKQGQGSTESKIVRHGLVMVPFGLHLAVWKGQLQTFPTIGQGRSCQSILKYTTRHSTGDKEAQKQGPPWGMCRPKDAKALPIHALP